MLTEQHEWVVPETATVYAEDGYVMICVEEGRDYCRSLDLKEALAFYAWLSNAIRIVRDYPRPSKGKPDA